MFFTKKRVAVLGYICCASVASVLLMGSQCTKDPDCFVGGVNVGTRTPSQCAAENNTYNATVAAAKAAEEAAKNQPMQPPPDNGMMEGGMMEGGMMEGGMMEGGMMQGPPP